MVSSTTILPVFVSSPPTVNAPDTSTLVLAFKSMIASPSILRVPSADCCMNDAVSPNVSLFVLLSVRPVPSVCVNVVSESAPNERTALSEISLRSSPIDASAAIPTPPATVNAPSLALVLAVVADMFTTPPDDIEIASVSDAEPIVPASLIMISSTNVTIPVDAIVIALVELAEPIVPPSEINNFSEAVSYTHLTLPTTPYV